MNLCDLIQQDMSINKYIQEIRICDCIHLENVNYNLLFECWRNYNLIFYF